MSKHSKFYAQNFCSSGPMKTSVNSKKLRVFYFQDTSHMCEVSEKETLTKMAKSICR